MTQPAHKATHSLPQDDAADTDRIDHLPDTEQEETANDTETAAPSWFTKTYPTSSAADMAKRYQAERPQVTVRPAPHDEEEAYAFYKRRLEDRFRMAQRMGDPAFAPNSIPDQHMPTRRSAMAPAPRTDERHAPNHVLGVSFSMAVFLTALACGAGSAGGYFMANPAALASLTQDPLATVLAWLPERQQQVASAESPQAKPVKLATVKVEDVKGPVNAPIALDISALPPDPATPITLKISGLPQDAYLTTGTALKGGEWMLRPEDVASAQLVVQKSDQPELGLLVTALDAKTGTAAAPAQEMKVALDLNAVPLPGLQPPPMPATPQSVIQPVSAPAPGVTTTALPQPVPPPNEILKGEVQSFLEKGDMLLKAGDILGARQFYLGAAELNDPSGAYGVARTYDPKVFAALKVRGLVPDQAKALEWYGKAAAGGHAEAAQALVQPPQ